MSWKCEKGHEWETSVYTRTTIKEGSGCPECLNMRVGKDNNLAVLYPEIAKQLHPTKNDNITAYDIIRGSHKKYFWQCEDKGHVWKAQVVNRIRSTECPECYFEGKKRKI